MADKDWSLIGFTLLMQLSAGLIIIYDLFLLSPLYRSKVDIPWRFQWVLLIALSAAILGLSASLLHLGNPSNMFRTASNLSQSWLSREIAGVLVYTSLLGLVTLLHFIMPSAGRSLKWLVDAAAVAGLILIYIMSRIYMIPTRPVWNSLFTPAGFYLTAIILGASLLLLFQIQKGSWASQKVLAILTISIPAIQLAILPIFMSWLGQQGSTGSEGLAVLLSHHMVAFYARLVLLLVGMGCGFWAFFSIRSDIIQDRYLFIPALLAWGSLLAAQILERYLFYAQNLPAEGF
jgi:anaerobic dimethyl sulfoxide reductase subunit C (anchor subunit)